LLDNGIRGPFEEDTQGAVSRLQSFLAESSAAAAHGSAGQLINGAHHV
jgi:hypothetical protein